MVYDIIVIGAGAAGLNVAGFMNKAGFKVLLIDKSDANIGGDCLNFGCVPSKALIHISQEIHDAKDASKFGVKLTGSIDIKKVTDYIKSKQNIIRQHENADYFRKQGMDVVLGSAKFHSKNEVEVNDSIYKAKKIIIATGSRPRKLNIPGIEKIKPRTNETIFNLSKIPKKLLVIGGGPIGLELGQAFRRLGSQVTVVHKGRQFLEHEEPEMAKHLKQVLEKEGINFNLNSHPIKFIDKSHVEISSDGAKKVLEFDEVLISIGRELNIDNLSLEKAGIKVENKKIVADDYLRTTNKNVLACGDVAGSHQFTHAAEMHASVIIKNFFSPIKKKINYDKISWVTYTDPSITKFGLDEKELKKRNIKYEKISLNFEDEDRAIIEETTDGKLILYISKNKIVGGSMMAHKSGELSQELMLAMSSGININEIFKKVYPYPTATRINKKAITSIFAKKLNSMKPFLKFMWKFA